MFNDPGIDISSHLDAVDRVITVGGKVSDEYKRIRTNYETFTAIAPRSEEDALTGLAHAVTTAAKGTDFAALRLTALIEITAGDGNRGRLENAMSVHTLAALRNAYATTSAENYTTLAKAYNKAARALTDAHNTVAMDSPTEDMLGATKAETDAYLSAPLLVSRVEAALRNLTVAATLHGLEDTQSAGGQIALAVELGNATARSVWKAWNTDSGRTGKWGALIATGAQLQAVAPAEYAPLDPAAPNRITLPSTNVGHDRAFG